MNVQSKSKKNIQQLIQEYYKSFPTIWKIQPPQTDKKRSYLLKLDKLKNFRGRKALYPYMGQGRGKGVYVQLMDHSIKMDLIGGVGVQILGHAHPEIITTVLESALTDVLMQGHLLMNEEYYRLCEKLVDLAEKKSRLKHVWLSTSGSMANENALKMVRQKNTPRRKILAFDKAFAGRTTLMAEITSNPATKEGLPEYYEVLRIPFYDPQKPEQSLKILKSHLEKEENNICAFIFEIILGEGGYKSAPSEFFISLFKECRKQHIAIWADEVQTFCRTGTFFAFEKWNLGPYIDLCTIGKSLQLAATFFTEEYNPRPGLVAGTFSSSTPCLSTGLTILNIMEKHYIKPHTRISQIEHLFKTLFKELKDQSLISDYDVFGLMAAFTLMDSSKQNTSHFIQQLFDNGVISMLCGRDPYRVRFLSPAVITDEDINVLKKVLMDTLTLNLDQN